MSRAEDIPPLYRGVLLLLLFLLQLLTPLLHGHFGTPGRTGWHMHVFQQSAMYGYSQMPHGIPVEVGAAAQSGSGDAVAVAQEPLEVDVQTAIGPLLMTLEARPAAVLVALACALVALLGTLDNAPPLRWRPRTALPPRRWRGPARPPPAQAPPLLS